MALYYLPPIHFSHVITACYFTSFLFSPNHEWRKSQIFSACRRSARHCYTATMHCLSPTTPPTIHCICSCSSALQRLLNSPKLTGHKPLKLIRPANQPLPQWSGPCIFQLPPQNFPRSQTSNLNLSPSHPPIRSPQNYSCTGLQLLTANLFTYTENVSLSVTIPP